jgi:hypothetical protein
LLVSKTFLSEHLLNEDGDMLVEPFKGNNLRQTTEKFTTLCSPNIRDLVASYKQHLGYGRYVSSILSLKANSGYDYIQDSCFPGQQFGEVFLFKMSIDGDGSGFDLVKRMQPGGDF